MAVLRAVALLLTLAAACTGATDEPVASTPPISPQAPAMTPASFQVDHAIELIRRLASTIGPREATSDAYRRAALVVEERLQLYGYHVRRQAFSVPAGRSGNRPVPQGDTFNVVAEPPQFQSGRPHLVVGAHLDTIPQAPGAVDNAAGIAIMIELARLSAAEPPPIPVAFVAFGAEEARVPNGGLFGSRHFVAVLSREHKTSLVGAIAIDRVGTGDRIPVCTGIEASEQFGGRLLDAARRVGVPAYACTNRSSDHWSFERSGTVAARLGPDEYPQYHTERDRPDIVVSAQIHRAGTLLWEALKTMAPP